ncbi:Transcription termination factor MTERF8, chloroplastic [Linum perenne]
MTFLLKNWHLLRHLSIRNPNLPHRQLSTGGSTTGIPFVVSYLINECGVRPESAVSAAKYVRLDSPDKADVVLRFFRDLGFTKSQIPKLFGRRPLLLLSDPEKHFLPRFRFLESSGFSPSDIVTILCKAPEILHASVENQLLPNLNFIKSILQEKVIGAVRRSPYLLTCELETYLIPSIRILRENGAAESNIIRLLEYHPMTLLTSQDQLSKTIEQVKNLGMDPGIVTFGVAIQIIRGVTQETWDTKVDAFKHWGWSDEVVIKSFTRSPWCMGLSVKKIMANMDYLVNEMGFDAMDIAARPVLISFSLKKRIVPRHTVLRVLVSKGLIESVCSVQALAVTDACFEKKFLVPYKVQAPELVELFRDTVRAAAALGNQ